MRGEDSRTFDHWTSEKARPPRSAPTDCRSRAQSLFGHALFLSLRLAISFFLSLRPSFSFPTPLLFASS